jgi:hypothetical protein
MRVATSELSDCHAAGAYGHAGGGGLDVRGDFVVEPRVHHVAVKGHVQPGGTGAAVGRGWGNRVHFCCRRSYHFCELHFLMCVLDTILWLVKRMVFQELKDTCK